MDKKPKLKKRAVQPKPGKLIRLADNWLEASLLHLEVNLWRSVEMLQRSRLADTNRKRLHLHFEIQRFYTQALNDIAKQLPASVLKPEPKQDPAMVAGIAKMNAVDTAAYLAMPSRE